MSGHVTFSMYCTVLQYSLWYLGADYVSCRGWEGCELSGLGDKTVSFHACIKAFKFETCLIFYGVFLAHFGVGFHQIPESVLPTLNVTLTPVNMLSYEQ